MAIPYLEWQSASKASERGREGEGARERDRKYREVKVGRKSKPNNYARWRPLYLPAAQGPAHADDVSPAVSPYRPGPHSVHTAVAATLNAPGGHT